MGLILSVVGAVNLLLCVGVMLLGLHRAYIHGVKKPLLAHSTLAAIVCVFCVVHATGSQCNPLYWVWLLLEPALYYRVIVINLRPCYDIVAISTKAVLITGCDSGFGHALALRLDKLGVRVFAACLQQDGGEGAEALLTIGSPRMTTLRLDVTQQDMVDAARKLVEDALEPGQEFWGLVNNAGVNLPAEMEFTSMKDIHTQMNVNCYGQVRMCKAFLPLLRRSKGRIVNVASVVGNVGMYNLGAYCMSKFAVEAFSSVLRQEMIKWDVHVATIEPGPYATSIGSDGISTCYVEQLWRGCSDEVKEDYGKQYMDAYPTAPEFCLEQNLTPVLEGMEDALFSPHPLSHYTMGAGCFYMPFMDKFCQPVLHRWEWLLRRNTIYPGAIPAALQDK